MKDNAIWTVSPDMVAVSLLFGAPPGACAARDLEFGIKVGGKEGGRGGGRGVGGK